MRRKPPENIDPKEAAINRLIKTIRRQHDEFIRILIARDRASTAGEDLDQFEKALERLDKDLTANEIQLKSLGYVPKHREPAHASA